MRSTELTKSEARRQVRLAVVNEVRRRAYVASKALSQRRNMSAAIREVVSEYNAGGIVTDEALRASTPTVGERSVWSWDRMLVDDANSLNDSWGHRASPKILNRDEGLAKRISEVLAQSPRISAPALRKRLLEGAEPTACQVPATRTLQRYLRALREDHEDPPKAG
jgi:hypothetical protein